MTRRVDGTVIAMHGPLVRVQVGEETLIVASRRRLHWQGGAPEGAAMVVGDRVTVEMRATEGVVVAVQERHSSLMRRAPRTRRPQVIAANVDQALVVFAARLPKPKRGLLDRFLVACTLAGIEPLITFNKVDQGLDLVDEWLPLYRRLGHTVLTVSARTGRGMGEIRRRLADRTTLFCGPSGVGKSSLLNAVYPGFRLKVDSISEATGKGRHTTSVAELMPLPYGGFVVDTPGLKEFGVWKAESVEIRGAFPELAEREGECRYANCSHEHEPNCDVRAAVDRGEVDPGRYQSYLGLLAEIEERA